MCGRAYKTMYILGYVSEPTLRRRVPRGLLKSEELHSLARSVFYGKQGIGARDGCRHQQGAWEREGEMEEAWERENRYTQLVPMLLRGNPYWYFKNPIHLSCSGAWQRVEQGLLSAFLRSRWHFFGILPGKVWADFRRESLCLIDYFNVYSLAVF